DGGAASGASTTGTAPDDASFVGTLHFAIQSNSEQIGLKLAGLDDTPYKVDWAPFEGVPNMVSAFLAGAIDVGTGGQAPLVSALAAGQDLVIVGVRQDTGNGRQLVARGAGIRTVADLRGKKIAAQVGTQTHAFVLAALKEAGLSASDVDIVDLT